MQGTHKRPMQSIQHPEWPALDGTTLDQVRVFVMVVESGSFTEAARRLRRAQSAVSYAIAGLERNLGIRLFDRTGRRPVLTAEGAELLPDARRVLAETARLQARAWQLSGGREMRLAVAVDAIAPPELLVELGRGFQAEWPDVALSLRTDVLEAVDELVAQGHCQLGVSGMAARRDDLLDRRLLGEMEVVPVAAPDHPLARHAGPIPTRLARDHVQIVISPRTADPGSDGPNVLAHTTWRVADAATKHALLVAGLGWGTLPRRRVAEDLAAGRLVPLRLETWGDRPIRVALHTVARSDRPLGPAARWLRDHLHQSAERLGLDGGS